jgi:diguanylate cyclase (GGDEF)-like protein
LTTIVIRQLIDAILTQPLSVTLQMLSTAAAQIAQAPYGVILVSRAGAGLHVSGMHGFANQEAATLDLAARLGDNFTARVIAEGRTIIASTPPESAGSRAQHAVGVPLLAQNQTRGALIVYPLAAGSVDSARIAQLELIAAHGVLALELARVREENARLLAIDPTTGMLKRELFLELADREFRRSWRYDQPITALIVDVDDLAIINLKWGHTFGDQVLREVANVCANVVRSIDLIGRYDGDAFALLLLMTDSAGARVVAERLRAGINAIQLPNPPSPLQITATLGVCSYPRDNCTSIFDLLALTQEAQRAARYRGVNQIVYG